jgi:hypothetical protein
LHRRQDDFGAKDKALLGAGTPNQASELFLQGWVGFKDRCFAHEE